MPPPPTPLPDTAAAPPSFAAAGDSTVSAATATPEAGGGDAMAFGPPAAAGEVGRLGKYRIRRLLGRGGMGAVYLAFDERLHREVALKVMLPKAAARPSAKDRFLREARAAARIGSDHVVTIYEADEIDGVPYLALQFLHGVPLDEHLKRGGPPSLPETIRVARETALGLAAAHTLGLVHRDIKPGNVWLEAPGGRVKILDFGLAKPVAVADDAELTGSGVVVGTPAYMAPEQGMGQAVDGRADLFSLGCMMYRLLTGRTPFDGPTVMAVLAAVATREPTPVRELNPAVPEPLAALVRRLMSKDPADRPPTADAVADELDRLATPRPEDATVTRTVIPSGVAGRGRKGWGWPAAVGGGLLAVLLAVAGFIVIKVTNKDGSVTEIKVPGDAKVEVNGQPVPTEPAKPDPKPAAKDADRAAAEWVLKAGGKVKVNYGKGELTAADLPAGEFRLTGVYLNGNREATGAALAVFAPTTRLYSLNLVNSAVTDDDLKRFADNADLKLLLVSGTKIGDVGLAHLKGINGLTHLYAHYTPGITDAGLKALPFDKGVAAVVVNGAKGVTDDGLAAIPAGEGLLTLALENTAVTDRGLARFAGCKKLDSLNVSGTAVTDAGIDQFKDCPALKFLGVARTKVSAAKFEELKKRHPNCKIESDHGTYDPDTK